MITMIARCRKLAALFVFVSLVLTAVIPNSKSFSQEPLPQPGADQQDPELDIMTKGPLHEAFAAVHQADPVPSPIIAKQPPEPIDEIPPEFKPDGENVQWLPGYWAWFEEENNFIWVSGLWRDVPPGRDWIPGYWEKVDGGSRWVAGFWAEETAEELSYLPEPPPNLDRGPSVAAPSDDHFYVPGNWIYQNSNYVWRAGYWIPRIENRIWVPACYVWTPCGFVYRSGYWDYCVDRRGVLFAPVYYRSPIYLRTNYYYTPTCTINTSFEFMVHLFWRPDHCHYYFGDYYHPRHWHYCSWIDTLRHHRRYDPFCAYYAHRHARYKGVRAWDWCKTRHRFYVDHHDYRPKRTLREQDHFVADRRNDPNHRKHHNEIDASALGTQLAERVQKKADSTRKLNAVSKADLERMNDSAKTLTKLTNVRRDFENAQKTITKEQIRDRHAKGNSAVALNIPEAKRARVNPAAVLPQSSGNQPRTSEQLAGTRRIDSKQPTIDPRKKSLIDRNANQLAEQRQRDLQQKAREESLKAQLQKQQEALQEQALSKSQRDRQQALDRARKQSAEAESKLAAQRRSEQAAEQARQAEKLQQEQRRKEEQSKLEARQRQQLDKAREDMRRKQLQQQQAAEQAAKQRQSQQLAEQKMAEKRRAEEHKKEQERLKQIRERQELADKQRLAQQRAREKQAADSRAQQQLQQRLAQQQAAREQARQKEAQQRAEMESRSRSRAQEQRATTQSRLNQQRAAQQKADQQAQRAAQQRAAQQKAAQQKAAEQKAAQQRAQQQRAQQQRAAQQAAEQQAAQQRAAQQRLAEQRAAQQQAAQRAEQQQRAAQQRAAQQRSREQAAQKAAQQAAQRAAQQKAAQQQRQQQIQQQQRRQQQQQQQRRQQQQQQQKRNNGKGVKPG